MSSGLKINKMMAFEADYDFYFQNNQGMFVVQSQLMYVDLNKMKRNHNIIEEMQAVPQYNDMRFELSQEDSNIGQKTLCIDVENILIRKVNIFDNEDQNMLRNAICYEDYIIVDKERAEVESEECYDPQFQLDKANLVIQ